MGVVEENLKYIDKKIVLACDEYGRERSEITLVAISKTQPAELITEAAGAGQIYFGENKIQEAEKKIPQFGDDLVWHMVGHLQTNKVKKAIKLFDIIESVDSVKLAETISSECVKADITMPVLLEVNSSGEQSKYGLSPDEIMPVAETINRLENIELRGLMTVGPFTDDVAAIDNAFEMTRDLYRSLQDKFGSKISVLSMGMTSDFERAIKFGSTELRIGTAIFGERNYN